MTFAKHLKEANRKLTEMRGSLQQKKQAINAYRLSVRKADQEIVELNEPQLKLNTLRVGQISEMTSWITKLEQETSNQKDHIRILQSELASRQWSWYLFSRGSPGTD
jgi:predicted  nucleic acid-binding Zn-ribbon protein